MARKRLKIEYLPLSELERWPRNPKLHDEEGIMQSIRSFGFTNPVIVDDGSGRLVAGHGRQEALTRMKADGLKPPANVIARNGEWLVPVVRGNEFASEEEAERYLIADNRFVEVGGWDDSALLSILSDHVDLDGPEILAEMGYDQKALNSLIAVVERSNRVPVEVPKDDDTEDVIPELPTRAKTKPGQVIRLGQHRLHCKDCLEVMRGLKDTSIDSIVTDPPYGIGYMGKKWDCSVPGDEFAEEAFRVLKPGAHLIAFAAPRTIHRLAIALEDAGLEVRDQLVWMQWQGFPTSTDLYEATESERWIGWGTGLKPSQEPAIVVRKPMKGTVAENLMSWGVGGLNIDGCRIPAGDTAWPGPSSSTGNSKGRWPANLYHCPKAPTSEKEEGCEALPPTTREEVTGRKPGSAGIYRSGFKRKGEIRNPHVSVKPLKLFRWLQRLVTPPGGLTLDPFVGSGTALVAAHLEGLRAVGVERDPSYCDVAIARTRSTLRKP